MRHTNLLLVTFLLAASAGVPGCQDKPAVAAAPTAGADHADGDGHEAEEAAGSKTSLTLPASTRATLGITFAKAEMRAVTRTLRLPGRIVLAPGAVSTVRPALSGVLTVSVQPLARLAAGDPIGTLVPPALRADQNALHTARHDVEESEDQIRLAEAKRTEADRSVQALQKRVRRLEDANTRRADLEAELETARRHLDVLEAEKRVVSARVERERHHFTVLIRAFGERTGRSFEELMAPADPTKPAGDPTWSTVTDIVLRAPRSGRVSKVFHTSGWIAEGEPIVELTDDSAWWFEGFTLESDLPRLAGITSVMLAPARPIDGSLPIAATLEYPAVESDGTRRVAVLARPTAAADGTKLPGWARVGVTAFAEAIIHGSSAPEVAVPSGAIARDGLEFVIFKRDVAKPDVVHRIPVDIGPDDGRFTAVIAGVGPGDEVVVAGVHTLRLSTEQTGKRVQGHVHADGSFHASDEEE